MFFNNVIMQNLLSLLPVLVELKRFIMLMRFPFCVLSSGMLALFADLVTFGSSLAVSFSSSDALFKKLFRFADLWRRTIESYYSPPDAGVGVWDVGFFLVLFSRFLVLKMCSRARVWAIRAELYPTQVQRHITAFWRLWNITGSNDPWHFSIQFCSLIQSWGLQNMP